MRVKKQALVFCDNNPASVMVAMMEAKVPGDAYIIEMKRGKDYRDWIHPGNLYGYASAIPQETVTFTFEWYREEDRDTKAPIVQQREYIL